MKYTFFTKSAAETTAFGSHIVEFLQAGDVITMTGDLGAGKTTLARGIASALKIEEKVISPTFNIMKCYFFGTIPLYHIDAYRLEDGNKDIGLEEYIEGDGICLIEWPQYIGELLPKERLEIRIINVGNDNREITLDSDGSEHYAQIILQLKEGI
ncbi:MAG TPA: tRNA (adenosine(37)-N6)-threonylcarbamoyltransferase complex ATPase subunit type 1 TsaE [Bacilli bacterium]|nr:tRNA (adenosine(37)-N6)-threonylcarbamoyltransferase complex ATPase subunit type 1 TsaE [Bacilli bacterium]